MNTSIGGMKIPEALMHEYCSSVGTTALDDDDDDNNNKNNNNNNNNKWACGPLSFQELSFCTRNKKYF